MKMALCAATAAVCVAFISSASASAAVTDATDTNWAGYDANTVANITGMFNRVQASWVEPTVTCPTPNAAVDFNVALSGAGGGTQFAGSQVSCHAGVPSYTAYYDVTPAAFSSPQFVVSPGDHLTAKVSYVAPYFVMSVTDSSSGVSSTADSPCPPATTCNRSTADVFVSTEGTGSGPDLPQARYTKVTFTGISIHDHHGHTGAFTNKNWATKQITSVLNGHTLTTPSALSNQGASFTDTWKASS